MSIVKLVIDYDTATRRVYGEGHKGDEYLYATFSDWDKCCEHFSDAVANAMDLREEPKEPSFTSDQLKEMRERLESIQKPVVRYCEDQTIMAHAIIKGVGQHAIELIDMIDNTVAGENDEN